MYRRTKLPRSALLATLRMVRKLVPALLLSLCAAPVAAEPVTIQGSTTFNATLIDPYRLTIERRAGVRLDVVPSKSIHGLVALLEGRARIAMISTSLEPEVALLRTRRPELPVDRLRGFEISRTRVAFVAHPSASVRALNREQLRRLLLGEITRWSELGGADIPVTIVTVQAGGGVP
ncbi:MAG: substrate-binding domain-containing protein, partial [Hyphomicrobiaceae bacterium]